MSLLRPALVSLSVLSTGFMATTARGDFLASVCEINKRNACTDVGVMLNDDESILTIRGYAYDPDTRDRPIKGYDDYIRVRHEESGAVYRLPLQTIESRPDIIVSKSFEHTTSLHSFNDANIGFMAKAFLVSLPPGKYTVISVKLQMSDGRVIDLDAQQRGRFTVLGRANSKMRLFDENNSEIPISLTQNTQGKVVVTGYPALRDGRYKFSAVFGPDDHNLTEASLQFFYKRRTDLYEVKIPWVENFPGIDLKLQFKDPLLERYIGEDKIRLIAEDSTAANELSLNGERMEAGNAVELERSEGSYKINLRDDHNAVGEYRSNFFVDLPDAPTVVFRVSRWDPMNQIYIDQSHTSAAVKVEQTYTAAYLYNRAYCLGLTSITAYSPILDSDTQGANKCAINWKRIPQGIAPYRRGSNLLQGAIPFLGDNTFLYEAGILYKDPETLRQTFYPSKSGEDLILIAGVAPPSIVAQFSPDRRMLYYYSKLGDSHPDNYFVQTNDSAATRPGSIVLNSSFNGLVSRITYPNGSNQEYSTSRRYNQIALNIEAKKAWDDYPVKIESWYEKAPEFKTVLDLKFKGVPAPPAITANIPLSHDQVDTIIDGNLGFSYSGRFIFDKNLFGNWSVQAFKQGENDYEAVGEPALVSNEGSYQLNLGRLSEGKLRLHVMATAMIDDPAQGMIETGLQVNTRRQNLITAFGGEIKGSVFAKNLYGVAPFKYQLEFIVDDRRLRRSIGEVRWEVQNNEGGWERILAPLGSLGDESEYVGHSYSSIIETPKKMKFRAVVFNAQSGIKYETDPVTLQAYEMPGIDIDAPRYSAVQKPVTVRLTSDQIEDLDYQWSISVRRGTAYDYEIISSANEPSFTFIPKQNKEFYVAVAAKKKDSPDVPASYTKVSKAILAVNPLAQRATISGPKYVETGKTYRFVATINAAVSASEAERNYSVKGYWSLPNGSRVDSLVLDYTPQPGDGGLAFYTYIDGYPEETSVAFHNLDTWTYKWPETWALDIKPIYLDVPAEIEYAVSSPGFDLSVLKNESLKFELLLPPNMGVLGLSDLGNQGRLNVEKPGEYQFSVRISDTRGNVSEVTSNIFMIIPTLRVGIDGKFTSVDPSSMYAPGNYYFKFTHLDIPRNDSLMKSTLYINNQRITEFSRYGVYVPIENPGTHEVKILAETVGGNWGEVVKNVTAYAPPNPECEIKRSETQDGEIQFERACTLTAGSLNMLYWTYTIDGIERSTTSRRLAFKRDLLVDGRLSAVSLTAGSNIGAKIVLDVPAGDLTASPASPN